MVFDNLMGLYALLAVVPFILIYLIRPKSFERVIPSLMFIMEEKNKFRKASFLRKLLRNLLFIIQLLVILLLALSVAAPYLEIPHTVMVRNNIIVIDVSASMGVRDGMGTRLSKGVSKAKDNLGFRNTVILAENTPVIILEDASSGETLGLLDKLTPRATSTNLGDAILLASDLLGEKKGIVTVISDFISTEGADILMVKRELASKGNTVNFIDVSNEAENIAITDLFVDKDEITVEIKNYMETDEEFKVSLSKGNSKVSEKELKLLGGSKEKIIFDTLDGVSKISLDVNDDLLVDNSAYISSPEKPIIEVLLIANDPDKNKIRSVLNVLDVELEIREPPIVNAYNIDHDIVFVSDFKKDLFVPTDFVDLRKYADKGGIVVIGGQEDLMDVDTKGLLPVSIVSLEEKSTAICADIIGTIFPKDPYSDEPCFNTVSKYLKGNAHNDSVTLVSANVDETPIIVSMKKDLGEVIYYGVIDQYSGFYSDPFYPIFWNNLINYLMKTEDIRDYNYPGGKMVVVNEQEVKTPTSKLTTSKILLDESGIYEFDKKKIAVNLINEKESDVNRENIELKAALQEFSEEKVKDVDDLKLEIPLLVAALVMLFLEFIYIKRRGDL